MAEDTGQERTESPTARRLQQAREKGQVARSKELGTSAVLLAAAVSFAMIGPALAESLIRVMTKVFTMDRAEIYDTDAMLRVWGIVATEIMWPVFSIVCLIAVVAFLGNVVLGGLSFSSKAMMPKASKMSPMAGFKRMFGVQALVELTKGIAKFLVIATSAYVLLNFYFNDILQLSTSHLPANVFQALDMLVWMFIVLCSATLLIVIIDVPFQLWNHNKQLKMTKQEVKDEYKDTEGKPEVKGRVRQLQREISQRKMMSEVPNADVIVVNPEHYAVAIRYDADKAKAPYVVAKGVDDIAFKIREIARNHDISIVSAPPLARAIYHTTKIDQQVPDGLFTAVAQVLAYVFQLRQFHSGKGRKPTAIPQDQPIPDELKH
ncbi:MAG: flagellar biosynthesis protein FlhB [Shewanella sp.]|nr:flagellar biosynthesis protein FlhB [Shewanella sp.]